MTVYLSPSKALGDVPEGLRDELVQEYHKITRNFRERRWEATELDGGRFCEIVYWILQGRLSGTYPTRATKPDRFLQACNRLADIDASAPKSIRLGVPRVLIALYDVRNQRGVSHTGGEVDANHMDSSWVLHTIQWIMAELVRVFHATDVATATATVEALTERTIPLIWRVGDVRRVLDHTLSRADAMLVLLYSEIDGMSDRALMANLELTRIYDLKRAIAPLHKKRVLEYDEANGRVVLSPKGIADVEERLLTASVAQ